MKLKVLFICIIGLMPGDLSAQSQHAEDTILVSQARTTYLAFPADIDLVDIGNKDFVFKVEKNIVLLKSLHPDARPTNMLIKFGQDLYTANLIYSNHAARSLYDFRKTSFTQHTGGWQRNRALDTSGYNPSGSAGNTGAPGAGGPAADPADSVVSQKRIDAVQVLLPHFKTYGTIKNSIVFLLGNMVSDDRFMYFQFQVVNKSHLNYVLDYVSFEYKQYGSAAPSRAFEPVYTPVNREIAAHQKLVLVYAIPLFASGSDGQFSVTFRETLGNRKAILHIPARAVRSALIFSHDTIRQP